MNKIIREKTALSELKIDRGGNLTAPEGFELTMTIDGVETPIREGTYRGNIVLTPTRRIPVKFEGMGMNTTYSFRAAVCVEKGVYDPEKSVSAATGGGTVYSTHCADVKIGSNGEAFNGIYIRDSAYVINHPTIRFTGNGGNDFVGYGSAINAGGESNVIVNHARIETTGCIRSAISVSGSSDVTVNDSEIVGYNGTLPENYGWTWFGKPEPGSMMMECPWMLGILGNNRPTVLSGSARVTYNNCHIRAEGWGALGTDQVRGGLLFANNCLIETVESGYGAFADGDIRNTFSNCRFQVADYAVIIGGGTVVFTDRTIVNSRRIGVMAHDHGLVFATPSLGRLVIDKGSEFNTEEAVIQLKNSSLTIEVDGARLNSKSGLILEAMVNDDPLNVEAVKNRDTDPSLGGIFPPIENPKYTTFDGNNDIDATFRSVTLQGDMVNSMTVYSGMNIRFENSTITGAITTATAEHAVGPDGNRIVLVDDWKQYSLIGRQTATYAPVDSINGVTVSLDETSTWIVDKTSHITCLELANGALIAAPEGCTLKMTIDGAERNVIPGVVKGKISLTIAKAL